MLLNQNVDWSNPLPCRTGRTNDDIARSLQNSGSSERELGVGLRLDLGLAVRASGAAGLGASTQGLVNDGLQGARASAAFSAAAEAAIDLLGASGEVLRIIDRVADIVVADKITGTNNHKTAGPPVMLDPIDIEGCRGMQKEKPSFQAIPN